MKANKMIQKVGEKQDPYEWLRQSEDRLMAMENLASTHIQWYTHKNPYGCWICDLIQLNYATLSSFADFLGPDGGTQDTTIAKSSSENMESLK